MCACKGKGSSNKQVTAVKQVVKKPLASITSSGVGRKSATKRIIFKGHM